MNQQALIRWVRTNIIISSSLNREKFCTINAFWFQIIRIRKWISTHIHTYKQNHGIIHHMYGWENGPMIVLW